VRTSTTDRQRSLVFDRVLSGHQFILSVQEAGHEWQEEKLVKDQARSLDPPDGRSLTLELGKLHERVTGTEDDRVIEAEQLSWSIREISDALVDQNVLPIRDISS
jgi:hypothetical protein